MIQDEMCIRDRCKYSLQAVKKIVLLHKRGIFAAAVVLCSKGHKGWLAGPFAEEEFPGIASSCDRGTIGKIHVILVVDMDALDVQCNVADLFLLKKRRKEAAGQSVQHFHGVKEGQSGMMVIPVSYTHLLLI